MTQRVIDERYATYLPAEKAEGGRRSDPRPPSRHEPTPLAVSVPDFARLSAEYAAACERLADAWPDQAIGEHGYSEGAKVANHLRIVAATVRGVARRVG